MKDKSFTLRSTWLHPLNATWGHQKFGGLNTKLARWLIPTTRNHSITLSLRNQGNGMLAARIVSSSSIYLQTRSRLLSSLRTRKDVDIWGSRIWLNSIKVDGTLEFS